MIEGMTLTRWISTGLLLAVAALLAYVGVGFAGAWLYYYPPDNAVLAAAKAVMAALAPMLFAGGLVSAAVYLSKRNAVVTGVGITIVVLGLVGAASVGASTVAS